jgi:hypothetical protein
MLSKRFIKARIDQINDQCFVLTITWNWFYVVDFETIEVFSKLEDAKRKFLEIRSDDRLQIFDGQNNPIKL